MSAVHFDREGRARCGARPRSLTLATGESGATCLTCLNILAGTGNRWDVKACPSPAAYRRELRRGGLVHPWCREAANRDATDRRRRRRRNRKELAA